MIPVRLDRTTAYDARREASKGRRKYGNHKVETPDGLFDSKAELRRWGQLSLLLRAGKISKLQRQVPYELVPATKSPEGRAIRSVVYIADFVYEEKGEVVVEDVKGVETAEWKLKRKLMWWVHDIWVKEIRS